ncbi:hypothetical protein M9Y10_003718 [Tritrichomonas musculus]|uniref:THAP9-like helix-turn-helix domain-containing protein n=1 Tax=Tritrichomonas musculus TaxID=1915356 RepID=A0ABR2JQ45_9EUKA
MTKTETSNHLLFITNINYDQKVDMFYSYLSNFGQISIYQHLINKGSCFVCYYDFRCAKKAFDEICLRYQRLMPQYAWTDIFPIEDISSSLLISNKNGDVINVTNVFNIFQKFGEISSFNLSDNKLFIKIQYFDTRSSSKAKNNTLEKYNIIIIKPSDNPNGFSYSQNTLSILNYEKLFQFEKQKNFEITSSNQDLLTINQKLENEISFLKEKIEEQKQSINSKKEYNLLKKIEYEHKYSNAIRTLKSFQKSDKGKKKCLNSNDINDELSRERYRSEEHINDVVPNDFMSNEVILSELNELSKIEPNLRRYSENIYDYALSLYLYSAKCYRFILQTFPFPCVSSLYNHFAVEMNMHKNYICSKRYAKFLIESYKEIFNIEDEFPIIIGGDATVASANPMYRSVAADRHVYLYQMQVLFPSIPVLPLYLKLHTKSNFTVENLTDMKYLQLIIEELNLICLAFSTDGDSGTDGYHKDVFDSYEVLTNEENELIAEPRPGHPILDLSHLLKTQRARFFRQDLALSPNSPVFKIKLIQKLVKRGRCFTEMNEAIRFVDEYAFDFFSPLSLLEVIHIAQIITFGYYLLPFTLWQSAIRYRNLSNKQRIQILTLTFLIFKYEYENFHTKDRESHFYEENVQNCNILSFWTKMSLIKYMNTLIVDIYAIKKYGVKYLIATNRLGNYTVEKTFGNTRSYMNNDIDETLFTNVLVHDVLRKEVNEILELKNTAKHPNEKGGVIISQSTIETFSFDSKEVEKEIQYLRNAAHSSDFVLSLNDIPNLKTLMIDLSKDPNAKDLIPNNQSPTASKQILMRWDIPINTY